MRRHGCSVTSCRWAPNWSDAYAKNIVEARLKRSGMRWSREGGQHVLDLRTYLKSKRWAPMWDTLLEAA